MFLHTTAILVGLLTSYVDSLIRDIGTPQTIEIHVIIDSFAFNKWPSTTDQSQTSTQRIQAKKKDMEKFVKSSAADLNAIFGTLASYNIKLDVRLFGIEIITTEVISREDFPGLGKAEVGRVLDDFAAWYKRKRYVINADHVMLLTGLDLTSTGEITAAGQAYLRGMCGPYKFSVNELEPTGGTILTLAHELAHSLGAEHDGDGNNCNSQTHIMAATSGSGQGSATSFRFSDCSVDYFTKNQQNCLLKTSAKRIVAPPVGELFSPDKMCEMVKGKGSHMCRSMYGEDTSLPYGAICYTTFCQIQQEGSNRCSSKSSPNGFVCGRGKRCHLGECLPSPSVPARVTDACPLGDTPSTACSSVATDSSNCYHPDFRRSCCASCARALNTNMIGCEYGDKAEACSTISYPFDCYQNAEVCCKSCSKYYTGVTGCEFGDRSKLCNSRRVKDICGIPANRDVCCQRCRGYNG